MVWMRPNLPFVFGVLFATGLLGGCLGDPLDDDGAEPMLRLADLKECDHHLKGVYVACEDEGPTLEFMPGAPPEGWVCGVRFPGVAPSEVRILWHPTEHRFGLHYIPEQEFMDRGLPLMGGFKVNVSGETAEHYWNSGSIEGHVLLPEGSPEPPAPNDWFLFSAFVRGIYFTNATDPLIDADLSVIWGKDGGGLQPALIAEVEDERYHLPLSRSPVDRGFVAEPIGGWLEGEDFEYTVFMPDFGSTFDQSANTVPSPTCLLPG